MSYQHYLLAASAVLVFAGCAHRFPTAEPFDIPSGVYAGYSCEQLRAKEAQLTDELKQLDARRPTEALPVPTGRFKALVSLDKAPETAYTTSGRTQGHLNAVRAATSAHSCTLP